jgi:hypothetical protein
MLLVLLCCTMYVHHVCAPCMCCTMYVHPPEGYMAAHTMGITQVPIGWPLGQHDTCLHCTPLHNRMSVDTSLIAAPL